MEKKKMKIEKLNDPNSKKTIREKGSSGNISSKSNKSDNKMRNKKNSLLPWLIVGIMLLLGLSAFQWYTQNTLKKDFNQQTTAFNEIKSINAQMDKDYEAAIESLEEMRGDNIELNELIEKQKSELTDQKKKIKSLIWTKREYKKAKEEILKITKLKDQFIAEVNELKGKIESLKIDNDELKSKNEVLVSNVQFEIDEKEEVIKNYEALNIEKTGLDKKVDMANAIKINFMEVTGYKSYDSGKIKKKRRAKNIHILRTCFTTETNMVTPKGSKKFMIRIIDPAGTTIYNEAIGSGSITDKLSNKHVKYTVSGAIEYNQMDTNACIDYRPSNPLSKGVYQVEMFNNGFLVGKGDFKLK